MKSILFGLLLVSTQSYSLSQAEADKYINNYENMSKKLMGFMNCISRALTGEDALQTADGKSLPGMTASTGGLSTCFSSVGYKLGGGISKLSGQVNSETKQDPVAQMREMLKQNESLPVSNTLQEAPVVKQEEKIIPIAKPADRIPASVNKAVSQSGKIAPVW